LQKIAASGNSMLASNALLLLRKYNTNNNIKPMAALAADILARKDAVINLYLALSLSSWTKISPETFLSVLAKLSLDYPDQAIYQEAVVNSLKGLEEKFQAIINKQSNGKGSHEILNSLLAQTIKNKKDGTINPIFVQVAVPIDPTSSGLILFRSTCATCHGPDGDGIPNLAPPLKGSEYVAGPAKRLGMIILNGLEGPVHVNGQLYKLNGSMPTFANNYTDKEISDIIWYLHNSFVSKPMKKVTAEEIKALRSKKPGTLREKDLLEMANLKE
ncbi:MAG TPA: cytochrome c, partial [Chitinophagaceae bacterium]